MVCKLKKKISNEVFVVLIEKKQEKFQDNAMG